MPVHGGWLLRSKQGKVQILLQKGCDTKESFPGYYDISSAGHISAGMDFIESDYTYLYMS